MLQFSFRKKCRELPIILILCITSLIVCLLPSYVHPEFNNVEYRKQLVPKFRGMCFGPHRENENPDAGIQPTPDELSQDVSFIANLTESIRTYSAADNLEQIPALCEQYGIDCYPGAWLSEFPCENEKQIAGIIEIGCTGYNCVKGLIVGNEVLLRHDMSVDQLIDFINIVKDSTGLPVTTAEIWADWKDHPELVEAVDFILLHVYGYWDGVPIENAAEYALEKWNELRTLYPDKRIVIGETGWPSAGDTQGNAVPSGANQYQYLSDFVAMADSNEIEYFYFEIFDEEWKSTQAEGSVGNHWGIYESNGQLKPYLIDLIPETARDGIDRQPREINPTPKSLPLYIYSDVCDSQNAFQPSGWMGALADYAENDSLPSNYEKIIDIAYTENPYSGESCIRIIYGAYHGDWGGIYWQFPVNNWGTYPGYNVSHSINDGANIKLRFYARGQSGGEAAQFLTGGIEGFEFEDSYGPKFENNAAYHYTTLGDDWKQYEIDLTDEDLSMIIGGFAWVSPEYMIQADTIYLDDISILEVPYEGTIKQGYIMFERWTAADSPYLIVGDVVAYSLWIEPGVTVKFMGDYSFHFQPVANIIGAESDSIIFTKADNVSGWQGISCDGGMSLRYCTINGSVNSGIQLTEGCAVIKHCLIENNSGSRGGGIDATHLTSMMIDSCLFLNNRATGDNAKGGGIYVSADTIQITQSSFYGNTVVIEDYDDLAGGGGIYAEGNGEITRCKIWENAIVCTDIQNLYNRESVIAGSGILSVGNLTLVGGEIYSNYLEPADLAVDIDSIIAHTQGVGVTFFGDTINVRNTIIAYNDVHPRMDNSNCNECAGLYVNSSVLDIENSTIAFNGTGVRGYGEIMRVTSSIIWGNKIDQIMKNVHVSYSNVKNGYPGMGNIDSDPLFLSDDQLIISENSPCVDAGHYDIFYKDACLPPAQGCLWNDIGAHGGPGACIWDGIIAGEDTEDCKSRRRYTLFQNYPNPFNSSTYIRFVLPKSEYVKLIIYNILGQRVSTLINGLLPPGEHVIEWDGKNYFGTNVASGIYLCYLDTDAFTQTRMMVLLK